MQSVARRELEENTGIGAPTKCECGGLGAAPSIDVGFHDATRIVNIVTIEAGAMIFVLPDNLEVTNRSAISFATTGYARRRGFMLAPVEIGFLRP